MEKTLKMPGQIIDTLTIEKIEKQSQARRSKIQDEVLVMLETSQQRDTIQSYALNLAAVQGKAGIRLDVPDFLRGVFRMFEEHAAALRAQYGVVKRAIRFDDINGSLYMDVKLEDTDWHRITADEVRLVERNKKKKKKNLQGRTHLSASAAAQKKKILLLEDAKYPEVESDNEPYEDCSQDRQD